MVVIVPQVARSVVEYIGVVGNRQFVGVKEGRIAIEVTELDFVDVKLLVTPTVSLSDTAHSRVAPAPLQVKHRRSDFFVFEAAHDMVIHRPPVLAQHVLDVDGQIVLGCIESHGGEVRALFVRK